MPTNNSKISSPKKSSQKVSSLGTPAPRITSSWAFLLVMIAVIIGASNHVAIKFALNLGWPPYLLGMFRMLLIAGFLAIIASLQKYKIYGETREQKIAATLAALCKAASVVFSYTALSMIPASRAAIIASFSPVANLVLVHLMLKRESVTKYHVIGIGISIVGIISLIFASPTINSQTPKHGSMYGDLAIYGDLAMLSFVLLVQLMVVFEKKALNLGMTPIQVAASTNILTVPVFALVALLSSEKLSSIPTSYDSILAFTYLVTVVGVFLFYYRRWLISFLQVSYVISFFHFERGLTMLLSVVILGEVLSAGQLGLFSLVIVGTLIASKAWKKVEIDSC